MTDENKLEKEVRFDGGFTHKDADQYVERCKGGAINLHLFTLGAYNGCRECKYQEECLKTAYISGEQADL